MQQVDQSEEARSTPIFQYTRYKVYNYLLVVIILAHIRATIAEELNSAFISDLKMSFLDNLFSNCTYGDSDRRNQMMLEYHVLSLILTSCVGMLLLYDPNLRRFYLPLARLVNMTIFLQIGSALLYLVQYPYTEDESNCTEFFLSRVATVTVMLGELHQIFLIANVLGIGRHKFQFRGRCSASLDSVLNYSSGAIVASMAIVFLFFPNLAVSIEHVWTVAVSGMQIYSIRLARNLSRGRELESVFSPNSSLIRLFESISFLQGMLSSICILNIVASLYVDMLRNWNHSETILLTINELSTLLFFIKAIMIRENSNVQVEYVDVEI